MLLKANKEDLIMFYVLMHPISAREILFSNLGNLIEFDKDKCSKVRLYQYPMVAWDSLLRYDNSKDEKENFEQQRELAESFNLGGRLTGKSLLGIKTDSPLACVWKTFRKGVIDSFDKLHLKGVIDDIVNIFNFHPFFSEFKLDIVRSPDYKIQIKTGCEIISVNDKIEGKNKGDQWCQKHVDRDWGEEASYLTSEVTNKKLMAKSEMGMIQRLTGMTEFTPLSPMGKIFNTLENKNKIVNLPSYVNPHWTEKDNEDAIQEFDGKDSAGYRVQILGKILETCECPFDIESMGKTYKESLLLKTFEINRDNFYRYKEIIILEKLNIAEKTGIYMDIGEGAAPTEIIIVFKVKGKYRYTYNITVNKITPDELYELVRFVIDEISPHVIGIDHTSGVGKALYSNLAKDFSANLVAVDFNSKIIVDYEKDKSGEYITDTKGHYIPKEEYIVDWSIQRIKHIFYNQLIEMPYDYKFDKQIQNMIVIRSGTRIKYECKTANHLFQAFQVMVITEWLTEGLANLKPIGRQKPGTGAFGSL